MTDRPRIYADFQNADTLGRLRLNCQGTTEDLQALRLQLASGLHVVVYNEDLETEAVVEFSDSEQIWVAKIDWNAIRGEIGGQSTAGLENGGTPRQTRESPQTQGR